MWPTPIQPVDQLAPPRLRKPRGPVSSFFAAGCKGLPACFGRVHLLKGNRRRRGPSPLKGREPFLILRQIWWPAGSRLLRAARVPPEVGFPRTARYSAGSGRTGLNYERFNCNNLTRCYRSWNYRGCWHQTCPPIVTRWRVWSSPIPIAPLYGRGIGMSRHVLRVPPLGTLRACCLP